MSYILNKHEEIMTGGQVKRFNTSEIERLKGQTQKLRFISEELLFLLRQRIMDLRQQLAVGQQGFIATEIIMRNNKELIRGVNRSMSVTISALETATTLAMAL